MKCTLLGDRARVLAKFLQFLAKIGPDLYMEAVPEGLILGTANSSSSGFARVRLCPSFFVNFNVAPEQIESGENCCRVSLKACSAIFRSMKSVVTCDIKMNQEASKLIIQLHCRENTTKTHFVTILEQETLEAPTRSENSSINTLTASQRVFSDILSIFNTNEEELTIDASRKGVTVKNYIESIHVNRQQMRTQLSLDPAEFDTYVVERETNLTFCLKEWRAFLVLAESLTTSIAIHFETTGMPIEFTIHDLDVYEVTLFMSTLSSEIMDSSSSIITPPANNQSVNNITNRSVRVGSSTSKRAHSEENVDDELNALLKRPKGRAKKKTTTEEVSKMQYSNPDIEDCSNNESLSSLVTTTGGSNSRTSSNPTRMTVARSAGQEPDPAVATIANRMSTVSPVRPVTTNHPLVDVQNDLEIIFLKDTDEDTDQTLLSIPLPMEAVPEDCPMMNTLHSVDEEDDDVGTEIPESPAEKRTQEMRRAAISLFRRCYEPSFKISDVTGLNRVLAENSEDED